MVERVDFAGDGHEFVRPDDYETRHLESEADTAAARKRADDPIAVFRYCADLGHRRHAVRGLDERCLVHSVGNYLILASVDRTHLACHDGRRWLRSRNL